nr:PREDICTED: protein 60A [Linepithema humile]
MGKLPIIPRGDTTRDDARAASGEQVEKTATTATVVARFSAIADSAAADRDRRLPVASVLTRGSASATRCTRENSADGRPIGKIADARVIARRRRDADLVGAITRLRRNTWHAEGESEAVEVVIDTSLNEWRTNAVGNNVRENRISDRPDVLRDARIAGDEHTCCVAIDVPLFRARRHDRVERRNRRVGGVLPTRSRSIGAPIDIARVEKILWCGNTVDSITTGRREDRDRFFVPFANIFKCDGRISSDDTTNIVFGIRESIGSGVNTEHTWTGSESGDPADCVSSHRGGSSARLTEIASVESSCEKRPCTFGDGADASSFSQLSAKIDPGERKRARTDACLKPPRIGLVLRAILLGVFAMSLLCDAVLAAPSPLDVMENFEDGIGDEKPAMPGNHLGDNELEIIRRSIVQGLGLQRIPDSSKANVSQTEYERAHREYLKQVQLSQDGQQSRTRRDLHVFQTAEHPWNGSLVSRSGGNHRHSLYFPVAVSGDAADVTVDHASLRFLLQDDGGRAPRDLETLVYLRTPVSRRLLLRHVVPQRESADSRWLELDSTEAAVSWLEQDLENHGLELEFRHDGEPTRREISHPALNVFTVSESGSSRRKRSTPEELMPLHKGRRSKCKGDNNKKCCRHELTVMFKDLKGFEFIVYPKGFDAGYCKGRCPPRYNPAHHHALLQSLLWKEDRKRVPKPCCAPSKLDQLTIVYFDENDASQLKVSYWKNIQVLECACS